MNKPRQKAHSYQYKNMQRQDTFLPLKI